jgi:hypothetical protein
MLSELALVVVHVPLSVPRPVSTMEIVYDVGRVTVTVPAELGSARLSVVSAAAGTAPAADDPPLPLKASVVVEPSPATVAVPLIVTLVIATGEVVVPAGWSTLMVAVPLTLPVSGATSSSVEDSVSGARPVRLHV